MTRWLWLMVLVFALCAVPAAQAQDDPDDLVAAIQRGLREFGGWWSAVAPPEPSPEGYRAEDGAFTLGSPDAPVTLIAFADFACPHCQSYRPAISEFVETYVATGRARLEFRFFPTVGGETTVLAGHAAECADEQRPGAFWPAHDLLYDYALSNRYDQRIPERLARDMALDEAALRTCMQTAGQVERDIAFGDEFGVVGTPTVLIRYAGGLPQFITVNGTTYRSGGPDFGVLSQAVEQNQFR